MMKLNRMTAMIVVASIALLLGQSSMTRDAAAQEARPLNVLFIAVDDLAMNLGCYGDVLAKTPHLDRLARSGVCFTHAYNQIPLCNPSRASVMTGRRPDQTGVYDLARHFRETLPDVVTLPQLFEQAGYHTARVGKIYHYNVPNAIGTDGMDDPPSWNQTMNPKGRDKTDEALIFNAEPHRPISGALSWLVADGSAEEQTDGMITTSAIEYLQQHREGPFFLGVGFFRPHTPYVAPKEYFDRFPLESIALPYAPDDDRDDVPTAAFAHNCPIPNYGLDDETLRKAIQAYYACTSFIDDQVGRLLDALEKLSLTENTVVVFWSDHGYHLGEHQGVWQKRTLFEQGARAPLMIRVPQATGNGQPCDRVVEFIDIYPTVAAAAGLKPTGPLDGRSLMPLLNDPLLAWDSFAITQILRPADSRLPEPVMGRSVRTSRFRYTEWNGGESGMELYDHWSDPLEFQNLLAPNTDRAAAAVRPLRQHLRGLFEGRAIAMPPQTPFDPAKL